MKFNYKWPTANSNAVQQMILVNKKTKEEVSTSDKTIAIGSATIVFYFLTLSYIYGSALFNKFIINKKIDVGSDISDAIGKIFSEFKKDSTSFFNLNTLSSSFQYSEKIGTTVFLIIFLALLQALFSFQNIYTTDPKRAPIIAFNYVIVLCWLLFMFIFPSKVVETASLPKGVWQQTKNFLGFYEPTKTSIEYTSWPHSFLAVCTLISLIINCFLIANLYSDYFDTSTIEPLVGIGYAIIAVAIFSFLAMIINIASDWVRKIYYITHKLVAGSEIICLILFGVFMVLFIQFPPVPTDNLACIMIPSPSPSSPSPSSL